METVTGVEALFLIEHLTRPRRALFHGWSETVGVGEEGRCWWRRFVQVVGAQSFQHVSCSAILAERLAALAGQPRRLSLR